MVLNRAHVFGLWDFIQYLPTLVLSEQIVTIPLCFHRDDVHIMLLYMWTTSYSLLTLPMHCALSSPISPHTSCCMIWVCNFNPQHEDCTRPSAHSISRLSLDYTKSILSNFSMADCNPALTDGRGLQAFCVNVTTEPGGEAWYEGHPLLQAYRQASLLWWLLCDQTSPNTIGYFVICWKPWASSLGCSEVLCSATLGGLWVWPLFTCMHPRPICSHLLQCDLGGNLTWQVYKWLCCLLWVACHPMGELTPATHLSVKYRVRVYDVSKVGCEFYGWGIVGRVWLQCFLPLTYLCDNVSAVQVTNTQSTSSTMKHVHWAYHWIRSHCQGWHSLGLSCPRDWKPGRHFTNLLVHQVCEVLWDAWFACWFVSVVCVLLFLCLVFLRVSVSLCCALGCCPCRSRGCVALMRWFPPIHTPIWFPRVDRRCTSYYIGTQLTEIPHVLLCSSVSRYMCYIFHGLLCSFCVQVVSYKIHPEKWCTIRDHLSNRSSRRQRFLSLCTY